MSSNKNREFTTPGIAQRIEVHKNAKRCPLCGSKDVWPCYFRLITKRAIECQSCSALGPLTNKEGNVSMLDLWNNWQPIQNIVWHEDDCGAYWAADLFSNTRRKVGKIGNFYEVDENNLRCSKETELNKPPLVGVAANV